MRSRFDRFARLIAYWSGSPWAFLLASAIVIVWLAAGPFFDWSDSHALAISSITTIVTFLMVFIIQNSGNRDTSEIKAMLRELVEDLSDVDEVRARERAKEEERP